MSDEVPSSVVTVMLTASVLSFATLFYLFQKHIAGRSLLPYEPRRRVPWGAAVALLAMAMPLLGIIAYLLGGEPPPNKEVSTDTLLVTGWGNFTFMVMFVLGVAVWLVSFFRADVHDLGLPTSWQQLFRDIGIGIFATIAAFLPIYAVQLFLINALQSETKHPLVQQLEQHNSPSMMLLGFAMAVIAAPLFEEFTFRGLLQGWLERHEDEVLAYEATQRHPPVEIASVDDEFVYLHQTVAEAEDAREIGVITDTPRPSRGWIPDLPHGWTPILISGVAFGLAHLGHGVAPVSLILFGVVLGYLYQRTHRLAPSITAHIMFNGYSMILLWLQLKTPLPG